ncbi:hypothetical protein B0H17DRAFT_1188486 [Mycena rosella]|uniref:Uncharacterized protein n=1 Tax=Mycena rosella TaxID=1033263 RepID=A0AAD7FHQ6_MYCRO|nr:hypothetical protein B0H17DRAFT_1188486 [Mycena rosella]
MPSLSGDDEMRDPPTIKTIAVRSGPRGGAAARPHGSSRLLPLAGVNVLQPLATRRLLTLVHTHEDELDGGTVHRVRARECASGRTIRVRARRWVRIRKGHGYVLRQRDAVEEGARSSSGDAYHEAAATKGNPSQARDPGERRPDFFQVVAEKGAARGAHVVQGSYEERQLSRERDADAPPSLDAWSMRRRAAVSETKIPIGIFEHDIDGESRIREQSIAARKRKAGSDRRCPHVARLASHLSLASHDVIPGRLRLAAGQAPRRAEDVRALSAPTSLLSTLRRVPPMRDVEPTGGGVEAAKRARRRGEPAWALRPAAGRGERAFCAGRHSGCLRRAVLCNAYFPGCPILCILNQWRNPVLLGSAVSGAGGCLTIEGDGVKATRTKQHQSPLGTEPALLRDIASLSEKKHTMYRGCTIPLAIPVMYMRAAKEQKGMARHRRNQ